MAGSKGIIKATKKIADSKVNKAVPSPTNVGGAGDWDKMKEQLGQGAVAFRLFRYDAVVE
jgi:hypothetical protein